MQRVSATASSLLSMMKQHSLVYVEFEITGTTLASEGKDSCSSCNECKLQSFLFLRANKYQFLSAFLSYGSGEVNVCSWVFPRFSQQQSVRDFFIVQGISPNELVRA